jgi:transposase
VKAKTLLPILQESVVRGSTVYTDELKSYNRVKGLGYRHKTIQHAAHVYVVGDIHTNTVDGFWSLLKRGINGVYHSVSAKHLQSYIDEYSFRYNQRSDTKPMFKNFLRQISKS